MLAALSEPEGLEATSLRCPQCRSYASLKIVEPDPRRHGGELRTFECEECGLPRTYYVPLVPLR
jgi:hypothetical protein